jgi:hypothetical protein
MDELPPHKREEIGDFEKALSERGVEEQPAPPPVEPPPLEEQDEEAVNRGVRVMEALQKVMAKEEPDENPSDPIEEMAQPTEEEKQEFIRCVLGNKPYAKKFSLFGGAVDVTLTDLTPKQEEDLYRELARAEIPQGDDWAVLLDRMRLVSSVTESSIDDIIAGAGAELANNFAEALPSSSLYKALMRASRIFQRHLEIMLERSLDSDFWRADGSSLPPEPLPEEPSTTDENPDQEAGS